MIEQHKSVGSLSQARGVRSGSGPRGVNSLSSNGKSSQDENQPANVDTIKNLKFKTGFDQQSSDQNVNQSISLHERRFNPATDYLRT